VDSENGNFSLKPNSPCVDSGDPLIALDMDGTRADMGALIHYHASGPYFWSSERLIDETLGNGNGQIEPGETVNLTLTLTNTGLDASGILATLSCDDSDILINQDAFLIGALFKDQSARNASTPYSFSIADSAINVDHLVTFILTLWQMMDILKQTVLKFTLEHLSFSSTMMEEGIGKYIIKVFYKNAKFFLKNGTYPCKEVQIRNF